MTRMPGPPRLVVALSAVSDLGKRSARAKPRGILRTRGAFGSSASTPNPASSGHRIPRSCVPYRPWSQGINASVALIGFDPIMEVADGEPMVDDGGEGTAGRA